MEMYFCGNEMITLNLSCNWSSWADKYQSRFSGIGMGETSGAIYRLKEVDNYKWKPMVEGRAYNNTIVWTMTVSKDGNPSVLYIIRGTLR